MRDKNEGMYRGGEGKTPVMTACPPRRSLRVNLLRVEPKSKSDDTNLCVRRVVEMDWRDCNSEHNRLYE